MRAPAPTGNGSSQENIRMAANDPILPGERSVRFGCGALLGVIVGLCVGAQMADASSISVAGLAVGGALLFGFFAAAKGDRFWHSLSAASEN